MEQLRIRLFGDLQVSYGGELLPSFPTQKAKSLFAFLVLNRGRQIARDVLCGHFWGERTDAEARKALRTALWRVRYVLRPVEASGTMCLRVGGGRVCFSGPAWVDVEEFESCIAVARAEEPDGDAERERLTRAAELYRADLLEGSYESWCQPERDRLRFALLSGLERLVERHRERGEWQDAIRWGNQLIRWDPLREQVHRSLMLCHLANGDRPSALRQFRACAQVLSDELGIEPMEETERLHHRIRAGTPLNGSPHLMAGALGQDAALAELAHSVQGALAEMRSLLGQIEQAAALRPRRPSPASGDARRATFAAS